MIQIRNAAPVWTSAQEAVQDEADMQAVYQAISNAMNGGSPQNPPGSSKDSAQQIGNELAEILKDRDQSADGDPPAQNPPQIGTGQGYSAQNEAQGIWDAFMSQSSAPVPTGWVIASTEGGPKAEDAVPHKPILRPR